MSLPYRYRLLFEVDIEADGVWSSGDGAKATADRLGELIETDPRVIKAIRWPNMEYTGKTEPKGER